VGGTGAGTPTSSRRRFARRAWARRWAVLRRALVALLVIALVGGAGWLVFFSSVLAVEQVRVSGTRTVSPQQVAHAAAVPLGEPLARVDVDRVRRRVESVPVVARADISRSWPSTVAVEVTERTPVAAVPRGPAYRLVDAEGVLFRTVAEPRGDLPVMSTGNPAATAGAAAVVAGLPQDLARRVAEVEAATMDSIELLLRSGRRVVWGSAESTDVKAQVLSALLKRKASVYDVSVPGSPTLKVG
jgi:cell division septal protein FtsQ